MKVDGQYSTMVNEKRYGLSSWGATVQLTNTLWEKPCFGLKQYLLKLRELYEIKKHGYFLPETAPLQVAMPDKDCGHIFSNLIQPLSWAGDVAHKTWFPVKCILSP